MMGFNRQSCASVVVIALAIALPASAVVPEGLDQKTTQLNNNLTPEDAAFKAEVKTGSYRKLGTVLGRMSEYVAKGGTEQELTGMVSSWFKIDPDKGIQVDVIFQLPQGFPTAYPPSGAEALGFQSRMCTQNVCSGFIHIDKLVSVSNHPKVTFIKPYIKPTTESGSHPVSARNDGQSITKTGSVTSEGDPAMGSDVARSKYNLTGSGVVVGLLSDSFDCDTTASTDYAQDIATGDLPDDILVLQDLFEPGCIDEGRAMFQIVHDVAPGASLIFRTAFLGADDFAQGILELAEAGATVIVDDIGYANMPYFQDGVIAQAVDTVFSQGIPYFSSAGNSARKAWHTEEGFVDSGEDFEGAPLHNFGTADEVDIVQGYFMEAGQTYFLVFQWDEPFASTPGSSGSLSDVDIALVDPDFFIVAQAVDGNIGGDALEFLFYTPVVTGVHGIAIYLFDGPEPGYMKWQVFRGPRDFVVEYPVLSSTCYGHSNAAGGAGIGAAEWVDTPRFGVDPAVQEWFSSAGGTPIFFDTSGNRLESPDIREQPRVTGPDGGITTFFGVENRFFGTSAAAPHVAAVAALMLEANPALTPTEVYDIIQQAAQDMNDTATPEFDVGYDTGTGYGFLDAEVALDIVLGDTPMTPEPTSTDSPMTPTPLTPEPTMSPTSGPPTTPMPTSAPIPATPRPTPPPTAPRVGVNSLVVPLFGDPFVALEYP